MMKFKIVFIMFLSIAAAVSFQSCSDDDDDPSGSTPIVYPHTVTFSHIDNVEFKMWTDGAEVNTANLSIADYMDADDYSELSPEYYAGLTGITFTTDSLFTEGPNGIAGLPYTITNDSIFVSQEIIFGGDTIQINPFLALGDASELALIQGYFSYCTSGGMISGCSSELGQSYFNFESAASNVGISEISEIGTGDTLIIYNQQVIYK